MKTKKQKLKEECVAEATEQRLEEHPRCMFCSDPASTCHHLIHQGRSNYLRCDKRNLIPVCPKHHMLFHNGGYAELLTLKLVEILGEEWYKGLLRDAYKTISDTVGYWQKLKEVLTKMKE